MAINEYKIPGIVLMENAALSVFSVCKSLDVYKGKRVVVFCGIGNNGGDGFAVARHMSNDGADVTVIVVGEPSRISGDARVNYDICDRMGIDIKVLGKDCSDRLGDKVSGSSMIMDAMLGMGFSGELRRPLSDAVRLINERGKFVLSIDSPTGGNPDNGWIMNDCVRADYTVALGLVKPGLLLYPLAGYAGRVVTGSIGAEMVFDGFDAEFFALDTLSAGKLMPKRYDRSHKGTYGKAVIVAGSRNMAGAAAYCAKAAYRAGCGYVNICAPEGIIPVLQQLAPQAVTTSLFEKDGAVCSGSVETALDKINNSSVCLIGPGLGLNDEVAGFVKDIIAYAKVPLIIDADALNALAGRSELLKTAVRRPVVTPHPLEMSRLTGTDVKDIMNGIMKTAMDFSDKFNTVTVLKDAATVTASKDGKTYINNGSCSALAKAGSGDVLAGLITGLAAQGMDAADACVLGVYIHSRSGIAAASRYGPYSVSTDDIVGHISEAIVNINNR